jgi:DNA repair protein RecO (recombination protein O)
MKTFKARGIVLKEYEAGESDKRLVLLCKGHGRLTVYARGARKPKSKFIAAAQLFTYADFILAEGRGFYSLAQAEIIESFYHIRAGYDSLCHAHLMTEVCEKTVLENLNCDELLLLLLKSLSHLNKKSDGLPYAQVTGVFLFRFFVYYGLSPQTGACSVCESEPAPHYFFCGEGLICKDCAARLNNRIPITQGTAAALRYILDNELVQSFMFKANDETLTQLTQASKLYWDSHFGWKLKSAEFI